VGRGPVGIEVISGHVTDLAMRTAIDNVVESEPLAAGPGGLPATGANLD
jgi:glyoxylate carboligase